MAQTRPTRRRGFEALPPRALIGMVHLPPLPGSPGARLAMDAILAQAAYEARVLATAGFDAVIVENYGDAPFFADRVPSETVAAMTLAVRRVAETVNVPVGVNVLRNDVDSGLGIAAATGAAFVRVNVLCGIYATDQGLISGRAADVLRKRVRLCPAVRIAADVHVKHAVPISQRDIGRAAQDTAYRGQADVLIVSGPATGRAVEMRDLEAVRAAVPDRPLWIGSGVTLETARSLLDAADGLIVGTCLKRGGRTSAPLDAARARRFIQVARR
jgi:membrane complex biogenesis BtpA family protein